MIHLLHDTSIFVPLSNDSFAQLAGKPITSVKPHTPIISYDEPTTTDNQPPSRKRAAEESVADPLASSKRRKIQEKSDGQLKKSVLCQFYHRSYG